MGSLPVTYPPHFLQGWIFSPPLCSPRVLIRSEESVRTVCVHVTQGRQALCGPTRSALLSGTWAASAEARPARGPGGTSCDACTAAPRGWRVSEAGVTGCTGSSPCSLLPLCKQQRGGAGETVTKRGQAFRCSQMSDLHTWPYPIEDEGQESSRLSTQDLRKVSPAPFQAVQGATRYISEPVDRVGGRLAEGQKDVPQSSAQALAGRRIPLTPLSPPCIPPCSRPSQQE